MYYWVQSAIVCWGFLHLRSWGLLVYTVSWPLNNMGLNCSGPLKDRFSFNKCAVSPSHPWVSHLQIQLTEGGKQYFRFLVGNPQMQRADCMHRSASLYIRTWALEDLGDGKESWNYSLRITKEDWSFGGVKSYVQIFDCTGRSRGQSP